MQTSGGVGEMKRKTVISSVFIIVLLLVLVTGCTKKGTTKISSLHPTNGNSIWDYASGNQPYLQDWHERILMQEAGFYFVDPGKLMLYYYDYDKKKSIPVCCKPDCEHLSGVREDGSQLKIIGDDQLAAQYKTPEATCDAYLGYGSGNITCVNGRLYYDSRDDSDILSVGHSICSISMDGSDRRIEKRNYLNQEANAAPITIHFADGKVFFNTNKDEIKSDLKVIDLISKKETTIVSVDTRNYSLDPPTMYHKKAYYILWDNQSTSTDPFYGTLYQYSFDTHKSKAIYKGIIAGYTFVNDLIYFSDKTSICSIPLDGGKINKIFDAPKAYAISFDGKYLYLDDQFFSLERSLNLETYNPIQVTKLDGTKIDNIEQFGIAVYGDQNIYFVHYSKNINFYALAILNKSELGKAHHFYDPITGEEIVNFLGIGQKEVPINSLKKN